MSISGYSSVVEHFVANERVAGSNPVTRSKLFKNFKKDIFSWSKLESLINLRPFMSNKRFFCTQEYNFTWPEKYWLTDIDTYPPDVIEKMIDLGTCYIVDCSRVNEEINSICKFLEEVSGRPTDAHIYFSKKTGESFTPHKDKSGNFIIQVEGETNFKVFDDNDNVFIDDIMCPGDAIYIPANIKHQAVSTTNRMSISFPMWIGDTDKQKYQDREWIRLCMN